MGVKQALIHHYFDDKESLYQSVVGRAMQAMTTETWDILATRWPTEKRRATREELRALVEAFADLLVRFYSTHAALLAILRHEATRSGDDMMQAVVRPQFDEIVGRLERMRRRGEIKEDVVPEQLVISAVAMACFPFEDEPFVRAIWPGAPEGETFREARKREIVETVLARVLP